MKTKMKISKSRNGEEIPQIETIRSRSVIFQKACELDVKNSEVCQFDVKYRRFKILLKLTEITRVIRGRKLKSAGIVGWAGCSSFGESGPKSEVHKASLSGQTTVR